MLFLFPSGGRASGGGGWVYAAALCGTFFIPLSFPMTPLKTSNACYIKSNIFFSQSSSIKVAVGDAFSQGVCLLSPFYFYFPHRGVNGRRNVRSQGYHIYNLLFFFIF